MSELNSRIVIELPYSDKQVFCFICGAQPWLPRTSCTLPTHEAAALPRGESCFVTRALP